MYKRIFQVLLVSIYCIDLTAQSFTPIGTVDPNKYVPRQKEIAFSDIGMVTTQHFLATEIGEDIIKSGGNAYDASVAIGFALAVVLPRAGNIGGGGFMVMHDADLNANFAIDYRERAPIESSKDMYLDMVLELLLLVLFDFDLKILNILHMNFLDYYNRIQ